MADFSADMTEYDLWVDDLKLSATEGRLEANKTLAELGAEFEILAKRSARKHGSVSIPPSIKFRMIPDTAEIHAGGRGVPIAALWQLGNRGRGDRTRKTFRHPVFGNKNVWVDQPRYRFFTEARNVIGPRLPRTLRSAWLKPLTRHFGEKF